MFYISYLTFEFVNQFLFFEFVNQFQFEKNIEEICAYEKDSYKNIDDHKKNSIWVSFGLTQLKSVNRTYLEASFLFKF